MLHIDPGWDRQLVKTGSPAGIEIAVIGVDVFDLLCLTLNHSLDARSHNAMWVLTSLINLTAARSGLAA
jgi:hypothetical protein